MFIKFVARLVDMGSDKILNWKMSVTTSRAQEKLTNSKPHRESCTRGPKYWHFFYQEHPTHYRYEFVCGIYGTHIERCTVQLYCLA